MSCRGLQWAVVTLAAAVIGLASSTVGAGILDKTAHALSKFQGSQRFAAGPVWPPFVMDQVTADFDYAAFAPVSKSVHNFDAFLAEYDITFDSGVPDSYYVYAYQAHIQDTTTPYADLVTVGTTLARSLGGSAPSFIPLWAYGDGPGEDADVAPLTTSYQGSPATSALWNYGGTLVAGQSTAIMFFSSRHKPTWNSGQVNAGTAFGESATGVPSPTPEPSSLTLLATGAVLVMLWRRRQTAK